MSVWPEEQILEDFISSGNQSKILGIFDRNAVHNILGITVPKWTFGQSSIGGAVKEDEIYTKTGGHGFLAGASLYKGPKKCDIGDECAVETAGLSIILDGGEQIINLGDIEYHSGNSGSFEIKLTVDPGLFLISGIKNGTYSSINRDNIVLNAPIEFNNSISLVVKRRIVKIGAGIYVGSNTYDFADCTCTMVII